MILFKQLTVTICLFGGCKIHDLGIDYLEPVYQTDAQLMIFTFCAIHPMTFILYDLLGEFFVHQFKKSFGTSADDPNGAE